MLVHWPGVAKQDAGSPLNAELRRQTWRVLERYHRQGSLRAIGVSNYTAAHLEELLGYAEVPPGVRGCVRRGLAVRWGGAEACQRPVLEARERLSRPGAFPPCAWLDARRPPAAVNQVEVHPRCQQRALRALCAAHGVAVVAYASLGTGELLRDPAVAAVAAAEGVSPAQALLLWGLQRGCAVVPKSVRRERIEAAAPGRLLGLGLGEASLAALDGLEERLGTRKYCWDPAGIA